MEFSTAGDIINRAAIEMGLISTPDEDVFDSTDGHIVQLRYLLNGLGERLVRKREWQQLRRTGVVVPVVGTTTYSLPADFLRMVNQTAWDRQNDQPGQPLTSQMYNAIVATDATGVLQPRFRIAFEAFEFTEVPANQMRYEYLTRYWVASPDDDTPTSDEADEHEDILWFDTPLLLAGLKLAFKEAKGLDTTAAQNAFDEAWNHATTNDAPAPVLNLAQPHAGSLPRTPETGWGS